MASGAYSIKSDTDPNGVYLAANPSFDFTIEVAKWAAGSNAAAGTVSGTSGASRSFSSIGSPIQGFASGGLQLQIKAVSPIDAGFYSVEVCRCVPCVQVHRPIDGGKLHNPTVSLQTPTGSDLVSCAFMENVFFSTVLPCQRFR